MMTRSLDFLTPEPIGAGVFGFVSGDGLLRGVEDAQSVSRKDPTPVGNSIPNIDANADVPEILFTDKLGLTLFDMDPPTALSVPEIFEEREESE
jgi:hypothetical protein